MHVTHYLKRLVLKLLRNSDTKIIRSQLHKLLQNPNTTELGWYRGRFQF